MWQWCKQRLMAAGADEKYRTGWYSNSPMTRSSSTPPSGPGRPKDMTKRAAILEAARQMFTRHDFVSASMDQIAACAGVSKLTVYNHFGDKDTLFSEVVREHCDQSFPSAMFRPAPETPLRDVLMTIAVTYFATISTEEALNWHRVMCSQRLRDSSLSLRFWQAGPEWTRASLVELLVLRQAAGELDLPDPATAAAQFFALIRGMPYEQLVFNCCDPDAPPDISAHIEAGVDMFLRAYARPRPL